jgi:hypothetical protein
VATTTICKTVTRGNAWICRQLPGNIRGLTEIQYISGSQGWALVHGSLFETSRGTTRWSRIY